MKIMHSILTALLLASALPGPGGNSSAFAFMHSGPLFQAEVFESVYVGVGGDRSRYVEQLFAIAAQPKDQATLALQDLFTQGTPVAKVYAWVGAMLIGDSTNTKIFYAALKDLGETEIHGLDGCDSYTIKIAEIIPELRKPINRFSLRDAYHEWLAEQKAR